MLREFLQHEILPVWMSDVVQATQLRTDQQHLLLRVPIVPAHSTYFLDVMADGTECTTVFHGTSLMLLPFIIKRGLKPSEQSHGARGLWVNLNADHALDWGTTYFEECAGVCMELLVDNAHLCNNRRIRANSATRRLVEVAVGRAPAVRAVSFIIRVKPAASRQFAMDFQRAVSDSGRWLFQVHNPDGHYTSTEVAGDLLYHTMYRTRYTSTDGWLSFHLGAGEDNVDLCISLHSAIMAQLASVLYVSNPNVKLQRFEELFWKNFPPPFSTWLCRQFGDLSHCMHPDMPYLEPPPLGCTVVAQPWTHSRDYSNAVNSFLCSLSHANLHLYGSASMVLAVCGSQQD